MLITIEIPDELIAQAHARGLALDRYLPQLLAQQLATETESRSAAQATPVTPPRRPGQRDMQQFFQEMAAHSDRIPVLPDQAFTRESFYQDHD
jgi:hypothetical protein